MTVSSLTRRTALCLVVFGCSAIPEKHLSSTDADSATLRKLADEWRAAARAGAVDQYMRLLTSDVAMLVPLQPVLTGQDAVRTFVQPFFEEYRISEETWRSDEIVVTGEWAFDRGTYYALYTRPAVGDSFQDTGTYLLIARLQPGGTWKYARLTWNVTHSTWPPH